MRKTSIFFAVVLLVSLLPVPQPLADSIKPFVAGYSDTEANYIFTGMLKYENRFHESWHLGAKVVVDAISSASTAAGTDGTTGASRRQRDPALPDAYVGGFTKNGVKKNFFSDTPNFDKSRVELSGDLGAEFGNSALSGGYIYSYEQLYKANTVFGTFVQNIAQRNTTLAATYYHNFDTVDTDEQAVADRYGYPKHKNVDGVSLGLTQTLSRTTIAQITGTYSDNTGALSDPKREVYLHKISEIVAIPERLPNRRRRTAGSVRLNQYLWPGSAVQLGYRYYSDDWGITSGTAEGELFQYAADKYVLLALHGRYYSQGESDYLLFDVTTDDEFYSASPLMEGFNSNMIGGRIQIFDHQSLWRSGTLSGGIKFDYYTQSSRKGLPDGFEAVVGTANIMAEW